MSTLSFSALKTRFAKQSVTATESPVTESATPISVGIAQAIVSLLCGKQVDDSGYAAVIDPMLADKHLPTGYAGRQVTYGELKLRLSSVERRNGTVGAHYPVVYSLSEAQGKAIQQYLKALSDKSDKTGGSRRRKAATASTPAATSPAPTPAATPPVSEDAISALRAEMQDSFRAIVDYLVERESATPTPGHEMAAPATPPAATPPVVEPVDVVDLAVGQIVRVDGELRQVVKTASGLRFNKTIV